MKQTYTLLLLLIALSVSFIACKKDYTCKCHVTANLPFFGTTSSDTTFAIEKSTKRKAKNTCNEYGTQLNLEAQFIGGSGSCSLQ